MKVGLTCHDLFQFCKVVSTGPRRQIYKKPTGWQDWPVLTQISHCLFVGFLWIKFVLCLTGDASGGGTRAEQAQAGYVIMFADMSLQAGLAAPVTPVSWRSHCVKRVVASASAAEAMGLSEAIAQGDWVRALWSGMVLGLSLREWRERKEVPPLTSVTDSKGNYDTHRTKQSAPVRTGEVPLIWQIFGKTYPDHRCSCGGVMERRKWQTP